MKNLGADKTPEKNFKTLQRKIVSEKKLTPFQKYEESIKKPKGNTMETKPSKLNKSQQSSVFLKELMTSMNYSESNYEKMDIIKSKVKSFVNPEFENKSQTYTHKITFNPVKESVILPKISK